jgi:hypothetical protein
MFLFFLNTVSLGVASRKWTDLDTSYAVGNVMEFECNNGYTIKVRGTILCRTDGQWNPPQVPTCDRNKKDGSLYFDNIHILTDSLVLFILLY